MKTIDLKFLKLTASTAYSNLQKSDDDQPMNNHRVQSLIVQFIPEVM